MRRANHLLVVLEIGFAAPKSGGLDAEGVPTFLIGDGEELPRRPFAAVDAAFEHPIAGAWRRPRPDHHVGHLKHVLEIDGDGDVVELGAVLEGWRLPPGVGVAVDGRFDAVGFVGLAGVAHAAFEVVVIRR